MEIKAGISPVATGHSRDDESSTAFNSHKYAYEVDNLHPQHPRTARLKGKCSKVARLKLVGNVLRRTDWISQSRSNWQKKTPTNSKARTEFGFMMVVLSKVNSQITSPSSNLIHPALSSCLV